MATSNDRLPDHFESPSKYANHVETKVDGSYVAHSIDPDKKGRIEGFNVAGGSYVTRMVDGEGHVSEATPGATKTFSDSLTDTTTGHRDVNTGGGSAARVSQGVHEESGHDVTMAADGSSQSVTSSSAKTYTTGGDGHHVMAGDQSFVVDEGGIHYDVSKGYTVTAVESMQLDAGKEMSLKVGGNMGITALQGKVSMYTGNDITIESETKITLKVGGSTIVMDGSSITLVSTRIDLNPNTSLMTF